MKNTFFVSLLFGRHALKIFALIVGYSFWLALADNQHIHHTLNAPVTIYRTNGTQACHAQAQVKVFGPRSLIVETMDAIAPINISQIDEATTVSIEPDAITLPSGLEIIDYSPHAFTLAPRCGQPTQKPVTLSEKNKTTLG